MRRGDGGVHGAAYHGYEIKWLPSKVTWYVDGRLIRTATSQVAYDARIQPTESPEADRVFTMSVDSVVVKRL